MFVVLQPNDVLQNRYRIVRPLGRGGMGHVYEAIDARLNRTVAVKETLVETEELRRAFEREAHLLANLRHPALPNVIDHFSEDGGLFLVMEFIPGNDLAVLLEGRGSSPFLAAEVLGWADQLLDALDYLHTHQPPIIHRDIKPANLKLTAGRHIILLDFGLAKGAVGEMTTVTEGRSVLGYTPNYAPVEQIQGAGTDARSDLYALGATLYHLLTGVKPPDAVTRMTALLGGGGDPLAPPQTSNPEVSSAVANALMRSLAINADRRFPSARAMKEALHRTVTEGNAAAPIFYDPSETTLAAHHNDDELTVTASRARTGPAPAPPQMVIPIPADVPRRSGARVLIWPLVGLVFVALAVIGMVWYGLSGRTRNASLPRPRMTPTPATQNVNRQEITPPAPTPLPTINDTVAAARARLEALNFPFNEQTFFREIDKGDVRMASLFLDAGIDPDARNAQDETPLVLSARRGHNHLTALLVERGADLDLIDADGSTALMAAAAAGHDETLEVLLRRRAEVNLTNDDGESALLLAAKNGRVGAIKLLVNAGAKINERDDQGRTALDWAKFNDHEEAGELLRAAGAK